MAYPISSPVTFSNTTSGDPLDFQATGSQNQIKNFVATTAGDLLYRASGGSNILTNLPIGSSGQVLTVSAGLPSWQTNSLTASGFSAVLSLDQTLTPSTNTTLIGWTTGNLGGFNTGEFNTTTGIFTCVTAGTYLFSGTATFTLDALPVTIPSYYLRIVQSRGVTVNKYGMENDLDMGGTQLKAFTNSVILNLSAADTVFLEVYVVTDVSRTPIVKALNSQSNMATYFSAKLVH